MRSTGPPCACRGPTYQFHAREMGLSFWLCRTCGDSIGCELAYAPPPERQDRSPLDPMPPEYENLLRRAVDALERIAKRLETFRHKDELTVMEMHPLAGTPDFERTRRGAAPR